ncbi:MAG: type II toxin-antitoxin system VapC family toxin [Kiritimatiellae bacterium]|jgi:predicted nucleic acid-binding protein|nr:type II toxin-antitoxin system VapC family toxin [Kiritimatiellia bacterium]
MKLFFDTSAWVPLLLNESSSDSMWEMKTKADELWAWSWMQVETEATLTRRKADSTAWKTWHQLKNEVTWVDVDPAKLDTLCAFNRALGLRAADAGHLFMFDLLFSEVSELEFVTLDREQADAARRIGLPVLP